jgi:hypothetical protein
MDRPGATADQRSPRHLKRPEGGDRVDSTRKLRKELGYGLAKLHGLQETVDLTLDDESAKALALQIREQAGICLGLLDQYQSSVPGRMWSDAERKCQPLREELKRTEMLFRVNSGQWEGRVLTHSQLQQVEEWTWDDAYASFEDLGIAEPVARHQKREPEALASAPARDSVGAHARRIADRPTALVEDDVEHDGGPETGPLRFTLPMDGDPPQQHMLVLVPGETGVVYVHRYGGFEHRHAEVEGFLVPALAPPEAREALDQLFLVDLAGTGIRDEDRSDAVRRVGDAIERIWYRGTEDRMAPLRIDEMQADELDQAWVPVLTPDGPGYLTWTNSD